jgi:DUF1365 family protein|tara:strand:+ start:1027 stop:1830 length:804 start_codon:yes stop_codon:yes gene_type:complete
VTDSPPALLVHKGETVHRRFTPFVSDFSYRVFMIELDIDRLDEAARQCRLFGVNGPGLFSFRETDHGSGVRGDMRRWAESQLAEAGIDASSLRLKLITFPRHLFYKFAPISVWLAETVEGTPQGVIYEVRNTFGERHIYVAATGSDWHRHAAEKVFHVSPFFDVSGTYEFSLQRTDARLKLGVSTVSDGRVKHMASLSTTASPASNPGLLRTAVGMPASTLGVTVAIHWEALKLWLKGVSYYNRPDKVEPSISVAAPSQRSAEEKRT